MEAIKTVDPYSENYYDLIEYYDVLRGEYEEVVDEYNSLLNDYNDLELKYEDLEYQLENAQQASYMTSSNNNDLGFGDILLIFIALLFVAIFTIGPLIKTTNYKK